MDKCRKILYKNLLFICKTIFLFGFAYSLAMHKVLIFWVNRVWIYRAFFDIKGTQFLRVFYVQFDSELIWQLDIVVTFWTQFMTYIDNLQYIYHNLNKFCVKYSMNLCIESSRPSTVFKALFWSNQSTSKFSPKTLIQNQFDTLRKTPKKFTSHDVK